MPNKLAYSSNHEIAVHRVKLSRKSWKIYVGEPRILCLYGAPALRATRLGEATEEAPDEKKFLGVTSLPPRLRGRIKKASPFRAQITYN